MKKILTLILLCVAFAISASAQTSQYIDGRGHVFNGNDCFLVTLYGGAHAYGKIADNMQGIGGAELVYNHYGFRASIGGAYGAQNTSHGQIGLYWNFSGNANIKHRAYIGVTGGFVQYGGIIDQDLLLNGASTHVDLQEVHNIKLTLPKNSVAPTVGARIGVDWRLGKNIYLTTAIEGSRNFINKKVTFNSVEAQLPLEDGNIDIKLKTTDDPVPVNHWGLKAMIGISIRLK